MQSKAKLGWKTMLVAGLLMTTACGKVDDLPSDVSDALKSSVDTSSSSKTNDELAAAIPKILVGLEEIKQEIKGLQTANIAPVKPTTGTTTKPSTSTSTKPTTGTTTKPSTGSTTKPSTGTTTKPTTGTTKPAEDAAPSGNEEFKKLLDKISSVPFVQASVEKTERHITQGRVTSVKLNMYSKQPNLIKVDVTYSSTGATGAKIIYNSGEGAKAKVRPGGGMSFITTELPKTDDRLTSTNAYKLDDIDLFGVVRRFKSGYTAELAGKTTLNGTELYILKVKATGSNSLDSRIDYEYIGYEPGTLKMRLWEAYTADNKEPFFRMALTKMEYPTSLADSTFKL